MNMKSITLVIALILVSTTGFSETAEGPKGSEIVKFQGKQYFIVKGFYIGMPFQAAIDKAKKLFSDDEIDIVFKTTSGLSLQSKGDDRLLSIMIFKGEMLGIFGFKGDNSTGETAASFGKEYKITFKDAYNLNPDWIGRPGWFFTSMSLKGLIVNIMNPSWIGVSISISKDDSVVKKGSGFD